MVQYIFLHQKSTIIEFLTDIKISRPGLWFPTVWIYLVPFNLADAFWQTPNFWIGLLFVLFPLNYLVYGLNDYNDIASDQVNKRKGNFLFGAKATQAQLKKVPLKIGVVLLPFCIYFILQSGVKMFILLAVMIIVNVIYNFRPFRLKERPPFEILIQIGYVITAIFCVLLNDLAMIPWQTLLYLTLFAFQAHIAGEIMDIEPDMLSNKKTTATMIGRKKAKFLMFALLILEAYILIAWFADFVLAGFLALFAIWLIIDVMVVFKDKPYTLPQMKFFGFAMNLVALGSMAWVLYSGNLLHPTF